MPRLSDPNEIRALLETDRCWSVYPLGDLSPGFFEQSEWYRAAGGATALVLILRAFSSPVLFALGDPAAVAPLLEGIPDEPEMFLDVRPEILHLIKARYTIHQETVMWRMILDPWAFSPTAGEAVTRLGPDDFPALRALYADGETSGEAPGFFSASMLDQGVFYGIREGEELVAAAGTHLVVPAESVAAIGNVYTRRDCRGQGLAARVTSAVAGELLHMNLRTIALNVSQTNSAALRVYERLGFERYCGYYEGFAVRQTE